MRKILKWNSWKFAYFVKKNGHFIEERKKIMYKLIVYEIEIMKNLKI